MIQWNTKIQRFAKNPIAFSKNEPDKIGTLHMLTMVDTGLFTPYGRFQRSSAIYIPDDLDEMMKKLSLQQFEENAHTQLLEMRTNWIERKDSGILLGSV